MKLVSTPHFEKQLDKLADAAAKRIFNKLNDLVIDAANVDVKKLKGQNEFRLRLGNYRVIFEYLSKTRLFPMSRFTLFPTLKTNIPILFFHSKYLLSVLIFNGFFLSIGLSLDSNLMSIMCYSIHDGVCHYRIRENTYPIFYYPV